VLAIYLSALLLTQFFNYNFAGILPVLEARYGISAIFASWTVMVFPLMSVLTSGVSGRMIDRFGYLVCTRIGLLLMVLFSGFRVFDGSFGLLLLSQSGIALAVPLIVASLPALLRTWFEDAEQPSVTAVCTVSLFTGIGLALAVSPLLILAAGFHQVMVISASISALSCTLFLLFVPKSPPEEVPCQAADISWLSLLRNRNVLLLYVGGFLGQGCFNAVMTWIAVIWHERQFPLKAAGIASSGVVFAGILGTLLIPPIADRILHVRVALWLCLVPAIFLIHPFIWTGNLNHAYTYGSIMGFFQLPSLAISLTLLERSVLKDQIGLASGIYWTAANIGILALSYFINLVHEVSGWHIAIHCVTALLALIVLLVAFLRVPPRAIENVPSM